MKMCPNCHNQIADEAVYCPVCGTGIGPAPQFPPQQTPPPLQDFSAVYQQPVIAAHEPYIDPYDHTAQFQAADISENKVPAMLCYLLGPLGVIIGLLAAPDSKYVAFHTRQVLMLTVVDVLAALAVGVLVFLTALVRLEGFGLFVAILVCAGLLLLRSIGFLQVCRNQAKEVYFIRNLRFLK